MDSINTVYESKEYADSVLLLKEYIAKSKKTQAAVAKELDISGSQLSQFLSGAYATPHTVIPKVEQLISLSQKKQASPKEPEFKMTSISRQVTNIIEYCHLKGKIGVAYGDAGIGKTMACEEYAKNNKGAVLITATPCFSTAMGISELLAEDINVRGRTAKEIFFRAVKAFKGSNKVIVVDEAQHLELEGIEQIRSIADASKIGLALVGNESIYTKMVGNHKESYAQLFSRIGLRAPVLTRQITEEDIRLVFEEAELHDDVVKVLHRISKTKYGLRGAVNLFTNTIDGFQLKEYSEVTVTRLDKMADMMNIAWRSS